MRILHLLWGSTRTYGGVETHVRNLIRFMGERGHPGSAAALPALDGALRISRDDPDALPLLGFRDALRARLQRDRVQLVISHNLHLIQTGGVPAVVMEILQDAGVAHLGTVHDLPTRATEGGTRVLSSVPLVTVSAFNAGHLKQRPSVELLDVIPPAIDVAAFSIGEPPDPRTIALPARLSPQKDAQGAVRLVGYLSREVGPITLLLSNPGAGAHGETTDYLELLRREATAFADLELAFNPFFEIAAMYRRAALTLAMPRSVEGFGMTPAESLASGRPVVATPTGGMDWVHEAPGVLTAAGRDSLAICAAVAEVLGDNRAWLERAREGRAWVERRFDPDGLCARYLEVCERVLARRDAIAPRELSA